MVQYIINIFNVKIKDVDLMHYSLITQRGVSLGGGEGGQRAREIGW